MKHWLGAAIVTIGTQAAALDLVPPGAVLAAQSQSPSDSTVLPDKPWSENSAAPQVEGSIRRSAYRVANPALTTLQLIAPLRVVLEKAGYETVFSCADAACGGFDFRFQLDLLPAPEMYVDLGDYRYVLMRKPDADPHMVGIVASTSSAEGFVHVTEVLTGAVPDPQISLGAPDREITSSSGVVDKLLSQGYVILSDLEFATGSSELDERQFASLNSLALWLDQTPGARVVLVGHTDAVGGLEANAVLSQRRAASVLERLIGSLSVRPSQVSASGAGALSPVATNLTPEGRSNNRRVEVVLLRLE